MKKDDNKRYLKTGLSIVPGILLVLILATLTIQPALAQDGNSRGPMFGSGGFIDEDGDGFNDLLPDRDGDGVPDIIDPDFRNMAADSAYRYHYTHGQPDSAGGNHHQMGDTLRMRMQDGYGGMFGGHDMFNPGGGGMMPGEPGQYGPCDSTGHGGMHDGSGMDGGGHHWPDSGGMGGGGGMGGRKLDPGFQEPNNEIAPPIITPSPGREGVPATGKAPESPRGK